ncbi:MAG TPA: hypothetical protein VJM12_11030 [Pyrinomonadaceae bacterium]|nr:hypothetical protein [Pyrinomonadaceae bacterium]
MKDKHIISLLEEMPLTDLSETEMTVIRSHTVTCEDCLQAFEAAQVSVMLLKERAAENVEPSPFFHTRVLARLREQQAEAVWAWRRIWRTAGALASSMAVTVAALAVLSLVVPEPVGFETTTALNTYSAEELLLDEGEAIEAEAVEGFPFSTVYAAEEEVK